MHIVIFSRNILINNRSNYIKFLELNEVFRLDDFWYTISPVIDIIFERNHQLEDTSDEKKKKDPETAPLPETSSKTAKNF